MAKCVKCNVTINDDTLICPLCQRILEPVPGQAQYHSYPNIALKRKKMALALRIYAFAAIVTEILLFTINYQTYDGIWWSVITGFALLYAYLTIYMTCNKYMDLRLRILFQAVCGIAFLVAIDFVYGFYGWSISYSYPIVIFALDAIVLILMIIDRQNYQSYLWTQLVLCALSVLPVILYYNGFNVSLHLAPAALGISAIEFLGTFIVGGQKALAELKRRFYV